MNENKNSDQKKYLLLGTAAALLIGAFIFGRSIDVPVPEGIQAAEAADLDMENAKAVNIFETDLIIGEQDNPAVTLIEYGSLTCPHCASFHNNIGKQLKEAYKDASVRFIYRDYPLDGYALNAAKLARCDNDKRESFIDLLYDKQKQWARGSREDLKNSLSFLGKMGGLKEKQISDCLKSDDIGKIIADEYSYGTKTFDISATPTIILNGVKAPNGEKYSYYEKMIDKILASHKTDDNNK